MNELVSVVIPVIELNYFTTAMESILEQTYENLEIIVIDSSEEERIKNYLLSLKDDRIKYFYRKKNGVADALNYGLLQASGVYIARMDADDISEPNRIYEEVIYLKKHQEVSVVSSAMKLIDGEGKIIGETEKPVDTHEEIQIKFLFGCPVAHPTVMFRRELIQEGWRYDNVFAEDYDLWTRLVVHHKFKILSKPLLRYRVHGNNLSMASRDKVRISDSRSLKNYISEWFQVDLSDYENSDFIMSYHLMYISKEVIGSYADFLKKQVKLLKMIGEKVEKHCSAEAKNLFGEELKKRWESLLGASDILYIPREFWMTDIIENGYHEICNVIEKNNRLIQEMKQKELSFVFYGYGTRGHLTLEMFSKVISDDKVRWNLIGIADAKEHAYTYQEKECHTIKKESILELEVDYIVVSSYMYYDEIKTELVKMGISEEKIIRDNFLYYI